MSRLGITTLGSIGVAVDGAPVEIRSTKAMALLVYLAETDRPHHRSVLAGLLWPDHSESAARNNLRQSLTALRKAIGEHITTSGDRVLLAGEVTIDTRPMSAEAYRGPFLDGFAVGESDLFEEWATRTRAAHEVVARTLLLQTAESSLAEGRLVDGLIAGHRVLEMEPWNEHAHRLIMRLLAADGRRHEAIEQYDRCAAALWDNLGVQPEPATDALVAELDRPDQPSATTRPIETPATPLFGRSDEIERVSAMLESGSRRVVTLVGPGGIGKTRLALAVAAAVSEHFTDGVVVAALEGVDDPARVRDAVAAAAGITLGNDDPAELAARLAGRRQLIVIDNAEQVADAVADLVHGLIQMTVTVTVLVTSRVVLNLSAEHVEWLEGLDATPTGDGGTCAAVQLFIDRARRVTRSIEPDPTIGAICARLGGYPLAIELAAGSIGHSSPEEILASLEESTDVLTTDLRDVAERHRSVRGLLEDTFAALPDELGGLLDRLSVFRGGFDRPAAVAVTGADARSLQQLAVRSLLVLSGGDRYEIHELIRQHAAARLDPATAGAVREAHARHHLAVLVDIAPGFYGSASQQTIARILPDIDNISAAWTHAIATCDEALIRRSARAMYRLAVVSGRQGEIVDMLERASDALDGTGRAELLGYVVALTWSRRPVEETEARYARAMAAVGSTADDRRAHAVLAIDMGQMRAELRGETEAARSFFAEARALLTDVDDPDLAAYLGLSVAKNEITAGSFEEAAELLMASLRHYEESGNVAGAADVHSRMAMVYAEQYRVGPALAADLETLRLYTALGNRPRMADSDLNSGASYVLCGAWDQAEHHTNAAIAYYRQTGDTMIMPYVFCQLAEIHAGRGDLAEAERWFTEGVTGIRELDHSLGLRLKLPEWGRFLTTTDRCQQALVVLDEAAAVWEAIGGRHFQLTVRAITARALAGLGRNTEAAALAGEIWKEILDRGATGLPFPIESMVDCAIALTPADARYAAIIDLAHHVINDVVGEITDPRLQASFLDLADVRFVLA
jgi:predicted ATPase/DNA-binding SARP family transcriptional activator